MDGTATLRRFNRTYTQRIGALDESFLGLGLPLGAARAGLRGRACPGRRSATCGTGSDLDSGYLSRLLRTLEERGPRRRCVPTAATGAVGGSSLTARGPVDAGAGWIVGPTSWPTRSSPP